METWERNIEIYKAVRSGEKSEYAVAKELGISRQRVNQIMDTLDTIESAVPKQQRVKRKFNVSTARVVYPAIREWMDENKITLKQFDAMTGTPSNTQNTPLRRFLQGETRIKIDLIKKILEVTGLTFEEAFYMPGESNE